MIYEPQPCVVLLCLFDSVESMIYEPQSCVLLWRLFDSVESAEVGSMNCSLVLCFGVYRTFLVKNRPFTNQNVEQNTRARLATENLHSKCVHGAISPKIVIK